MDAAASKLEYVPYVEIRRVEYMAYRKIVDYLRDDDCCAAVRLVQLLDDLDITV